LLVFISVILIFTAPGVCYTRYINDIRTTDEICPSENFLPMGVNRWSNGVHFQHRGQNVWGQLAIVIIAILFALPPLGLSCFQIATGIALFYMQLCLSTVSILVFLALGGVETWYATGYSHMGPLIRQIGGGQFSGCMNLPNCDILFVVKGWAAAAAFLFLCAVLFLLDIGMQFLLRDKYSQTYATPMLSRASYGPSEPNRIDSYRTRIHVGRLLQFLYYEIKFSTVSCMHVFGFDEIQIKVEGYE
uniref:MARVEL domain-containing protein n=1 Tax=Elaeophora elaphi TaxID=1147741 RepID=A0A0R3S0P7_9BILA